MTKVTPIPSLHPVALRRYKISCPAYRGISVN